MQQHYNKLKKKYDDFEKFLLKKGISLAKDTGIGYWGVSHLDSVFELFKKIDLHKHKRFLDLGSGDGRVVLLAALFDIDEAHGIEIDPWLADSSLHIMRELKLPHFKKVKFKVGDFRHHKLDDFDVIYSSPDQPFHRNQLESKLHRELKGKLIVHGYEFHPRGLKKKREHMINGEKFVEYGLV